MLLLVVCTPLSFSIRFFFYSSPLFFSMEIHAFICSVTVCVFFFFVVVVVFVLAMWSRASFTLTVRHRGKLITVFLRHTDMKKRPQGFLAYVCMLRRCEIVTWPCGEQRKRCTYVSVLIATQARILGRVFQVFSRCQFAASTYWERTATFSIR